MADQLRMTLPTQFVLRALLADPQAELYGVEIGEAAGLPSGTVHPILARLEGLRWVQSRWEDIDPKGGRAPGAALLPAHRGRRAAGAHRTGGGVSGQAPGAYSTAAGGTVMTAEGWGHG
jgi:PadR family transcriptional regulator, regulatory protein PadR